MAVLDDILHWSEERDRPYWHRDALRRILVNGLIGSEDLSELQNICLKQYGVLTHGQTQNIESQALSSADFPDQACSKDTVRILGISNIKGVNCLAPDQKLELNDQGLTVVYGDNGAGKSGYARILRKTCHARHRGERILPNAFASQADGPPSADIEFQLGDLKQQLTWTDGIGSPSCLSQVNYFDSDCAAVHVDAIHGVAFTPFGLDMLPKLAGAAQLLSESIDKLISEQELLKPVYLRDPGAEPGTRVRMCIDSITQSSSIDDFASLASLSPAEQERHKNLTEILNNNPDVRVRELENVVVRLQQLTSMTQTATDALSRQNVCRLQSQHSDWVANEKAALAATEKAFSALPINGVGEKEWQVLWESARKFSTSFCYPEQEFPFVSENAKCVLCLQPLTLEAKERMLTFEQFIKADTQKAADESNQLIKNEVQKLQSLKIGSAAVKDCIVDIDESQKMLRDQVITFHRIAWGVRRRLIANCAGHSWNAVPELPASPVAEIQMLVSMLQERIEQLTQASSADDRAMLEAEHKELTSRRWLSTVMGDIKLEIKRQEVIAKLQAAKKSTDTRGITRKSTELTAKYVTETLKSRFKSEVKAIGGGALNVELVAQSGQQGIARYRLGLQNSNSRLSLNQVLSEGELKCIALAGFFTELSTETTNSALIFDDPVSSLDHMWRRRVAEKLVSEASNRQLIVFTHDIAFLIELIGACKLQRIAIKHAYLQRGSQHAGECIDGRLPWPAMKLNDRIGYLNEELQNASAARAAKGPAVYEMLARRLIGLLRETWERFVEEVLLHGVVYRFDRPIQTQKVRYLTDISDSDVQRVVAGMCFTSRFLYGHDSPRPENDPVPDPDELKDKIEELDTFAKEVRRRREKQR